MSIHPSLRTKKNASGAFRNVLKRHERVRHLMEQGTWPDGRSMFGLPKVKQVKMKARKPTKGKEEAATSATTPAGAPPSSS